MCSRQYFWTSDVRSLVRGVHAADVWIHVDCAMECMRNIINERLYLGSNIYSSGDKALNSA